MDSMEARHDFETLEIRVRRHVTDALGLARGNLRQTAVLLGVSRWAVARMVKRFELRDVVAAMRNQGEHATRTPEGERADETVRYRHDG